MHSTTRESESLGRIVVRLDRTDALESFTPESPPTRTELESRGYVRIGDDSGVERRFVPAPELPDTLPQWDRLPGVETGVVNGNSPRRQFIQQLRYRRRYFTGSRYDHCPFQVFSELFRADAPFLKRRRCCSSNLNDGPVSNQCSCNVSIRQSAAHDEMIVAVHEYAYHVISCGSLNAETRGSGTG